MTYSYDNSNVYILSLAKDKSDNNYVFSDTNNNLSLNQININQHKLEDSLDLSYFSNNIQYSVINGNDFSDLYINDGTNMFAYNCSDGKVKRLFNWVNAGVSVMEVNYVFAENDGSFICAGVTSPLNQLVISVVLKSDNTSVSNKEEIVLAGSEDGITTLIENQVVKFNSTSDKYTVNIKKYKSYDVQQLNSDILSGNIPDILISDSSMPIDSYVSKGLFADLYDFIDADTELKREDFLPNLMKACEDNGKLYRITVLSDTHSNK